MKSASPPVVTGNPDELQLLVESKTKRYAVAPAVNEPRFTVIIIVLLSQEDGICGSLIVQLAQFELFPSITLA